MSNFDVCVCFDQLFFKNMQRFNRKLKNENIFKEVHSKAKNIMKIQKVNSL